MNRTRKMHRSTIELGLAGGSQKAIADALGVHRTYVSHILAGRNKPTDDFKIALRASVGIDAADRVLAALEGET